MSLPYIAEKLAAALRSKPCTCIETGSWPRFKADAKAHQERKCSRCEALELYDAHTSIVQLPKGKP